MVIDFDDFARNHIISDQCQSHDCREQLEALHEVNPKFKATLFAIPAEMTYELLEWSKNTDWVELAVHGFTHSSNYECEKMTLDDFSMAMAGLEPILEAYFVKGFKAPGWQISDDCYKWLRDNDWWVADQSYNNVRRAKIAKELPAYVNNNGNFVAWNGDQDTDIGTAWHGHTWNCMGNGIEETMPQLRELIKNVKLFQFVSEVL